MYIHTKLLVHYPASPRLLVSTSEWMELPFISPTSRLKKSSQQSLHSPSLAYYQVTFSALSWVSFCKFNFSRNFSVLYKFSNLLLMTVFSLFLKPLLCLCITLISSFSLDQSSQPSFQRTSFLILLIFLLVCLYFLIYRFQLLYVFPSLHSFSKFPESDA